MTTIAVLGDGSWGTAIALHLAQNPAHSVRLWSAREENGRLLRERRENGRFLPGVPIPENILLTAKEQEAVEGASLWVTAIPTVFLRSTLTRFQGLRDSQISLLSLTKGIEIDTFLRPSEIIRELLECESVAVLRVGRPLR